MYLLFRDGVLFGRNKKEKTIKTFCLFVLQQCIICPRYKDLKGELRSDLYCSLLSIKTNEILHLILLIK